MEEDKSCLDELKKDYAEIQKKHGLPEFDELNQEFSIEKIQELETDYLLREVRRFMSEKFSNYLRLVETVLNPVNASVFVFSFIKTLSQEDKKLLEDVFKKLMKIELEAISLDVDYSEEKEIEYVKNSWKFWKEIRVDMKKVMVSVKKNWDNKVEAGKRGYFG